MSEQATSAPRADRPMFKAKCTKCGKEGIEVPFEPKPGRDVLCNDCFAEKRKSMPRRY